MQYIRMFCSSVVALLAIGVLAMASAQSSLPPEARSRILIVEIDRALAAKDEQLALSKFQEMNAGNLPRPAALHITEAKLAGRAKDYARSKSALERYFKVSGSADKDYDEAAQIYASLNTMQADAKAKADAAAGDARAKADAAALAGDEKRWSEAQVQNSCSGYLSYLKEPASRRDHAAKAVLAMEKANCGAVSFYDVPADSGAAIVAREREVLELRGRSLEAAALATGIQGVWRPADDASRCSPVVRFYATQFAVTGGYLLLYKYGRVEGKYVINQVEGSAISVYHFYENGTRSGRETIEIKGKQLSFGRNRYVKC